MFHYSPQEVFTKEGGTAQLLSLRSAIGPPAIPARFNFRLFALFLLQLSHIVGFLSLTDFYWALFVNGLNLNTFRIQMNIESDIEWLLNIQNQVTTRPVCKSFQECRRTDSLKIIFNLKIKKVKLQKFFLPHSISFCWWVVSFLLSLLSTIQYPHLPIPRCGQLEWNRSKINKMYIQQRFPNCLEEEL